MATIARQQVLIAEHDDGLRRALAWALRTDGYRVLEARHGGELLEHLGAALLKERAWVDLLIVDAVMPVCDGLSAVGALQSLGWSTPVVVLSDEPLDGVERPRTRVVGKSCPTETLRATVDGLLQRALPA